MKRHFTFIVGIALLVLITGCVANLSFNNRPNFETILEARKLQSGKNNPISIRWLPPSFTNMQESIIVKGLTVKTPTGTNLSSRIIELLDASVGVDNSSNRVLRIAPFEAESKFEFSSNNIKHRQTIIVASCNFEAEFIIGKKTWTDKFFSEKRSSEAVVSSQTDLLERVWDDIALQVAKSVSSNI